jgi:hypothetical protein
MIELSKYQQVAFTALSLEDKNEREEAISKLFLEMEIELGYIDERRSDAEFGVRELIARDKDIREKMQAIKVLIQTLKKSEDAEEAEKMENILKLFNTL